MDSNDNFHDLPAPSSTEAKLWKAALDRVVGCVVVLK